MLNYLDQLESEAIYVFREVIHQFERPVLLFSGGKDSIVLLHLARKAFYPGKIPFPLLHIDTGHNFPETIKYRDELINEMNLECIIGSVQEAIDKGEVSEEGGYYNSRNRLQTHVLLAAIENRGFTAAIGGGRRDEEKARAKERFFSHRNSFGEWDPKNQRAELWDLYNGKMKKGEHFRVFPLSNWTELDIWQYIANENMKIPSIYFSHKREVFSREGILLALSPYTKLKENEEIFVENVRCRTIGDMSCTGMWKSDASNLNEIIAEISISQITERGARVDDKTSESSMEDRKVEGYF